MGTRGSHIDEVETMRTNIEIDEKLMSDALKATGLKTKKDAVEQGLKALIRLKKQEEIKCFRGKLKWSGDLDDMRRVS
jgi:Arc/MetJ family transcription regulator